MPVPSDEQFGADWCRQVRQRMLDPIDHVTYFESVLAPPGGAPALPVITPGCCPAGSWEQCPFVAVHTIGEITAMADDTPPAHQALYPVGVCVNFDSDARP